MPDEEEAHWLENQADFSRILARQMDEFNRQMSLMRDQIMTAFAIPATEAMERLTNAIGEVGMPDLSFPDPYFAGPRRRRPYQRTESELDPAASQESNADGELLNRTRGPIPVMRHDLRPATGHCGRCNEPAIARCYTIGCHIQGVKMCAKHLHEDHDQKTLPEGVPHE